MLGLNRRPHLFFLTVVVDLPVEILIEGFINDIADFTGADCHMVLKAILTDVT